MFNPQDYSQLAKWCNHRDVVAPPKDLLSSVGFIVDDVACGFIYLTNSSVAILDCFISCPHSDKKIRDKALNLITIELTAYAKNSGCRLIKCDSKIREVINRAYDHGFKEIGQFTSLVKEI